MIVYVIQFTKKKREKKWGRTSVHIVKHTNTQAHSIDKATTKMNRSYFVCSSELVRIRKSGKKSSSNIYYLIDENLIKV